MYLIMVKIICQNLMSLARILMIRQKNPIKIVAMTLLQAIKIQKDKSHQFWPFFVAS